MKHMIKRIILIMMITGTLLFTGCDKVNFGFFESSKEDTEFVQILDDEDDSDTIKKETDSKSKEKDNKKSNTKKDDKNNSNNKDTIKEKDTDKDNSTDKLKDTTKGEANNSSNPSPTPTPIQPDANRDLQVYTVNGGSGDIEPVIALVPQDSKITAQLIVDTVVESLADQSIIIKVDSVSTEGNKIIVNFTKDKAPFSDMGSGYEGAILDAIAQSLVDNLKEYSKVIYRIENQPYVSGAFEYGINEAHLGDN